MSAYPPVTTVEDLDTLDQAEIVEGFVDAYNGEPEPGDNRSRSYWHGYQNGIDDTTKRYRPESWALVTDMRAKGRLGPFHKEERDG